MGSSPVRRSAAWQTASVVVDHLNIIDAVESVLVQKEVDGGVNVIAPQTPAQTVDLVLAGKPSLWQGTNGGTPALDDVARRPEVASVTVRRKQRRVNLRLEPAWIEGMGTALEENLEGALPTADLAAGRRIVIDFCDPNATKAFHVGHLRNLALGSALAALSRAAGADVATQSHVGDIGRSMGEALAGYLSFHDGDSPQSAGVKSDRFVGACYQRYVASLGEMAPGERSLATDPALSREDRHYDDLAEDLLSRWLAGDEETTALWRRVRGWVMEGQHATLDRLGVGFDRLFFESDFVTDMDAFVERATAAGVAERAANGVVGYPTGREEYPYMVLERADGQWTQYLRCLALWRATAPLLEGTESIQVMGSEWLPLEAHGESILSGLDPGRQCHPATYVVHGMVMTGDAALSSSRGAPLLVDDVLDGVLADPRLSALCVGHDRTSAAELTAVVALGHVLGEPLAAPVGVSPEQILDPRENAGWTLAEAWAEALQPKYDGHADPAPDEAAYRFLMVQSQLHRRFVAGALDSLDVLPLMRFHTHLSQWFLQTARTPRLARAMRAVLGQGLAALGLRRQASSPPSMTIA